MINHLLIRRLPYDSLKDFTPLANLYNNETLLAIHSSVPASNLQEFIEYAKARPGDLNNGASGAMPPLLSVQLIVVSGRICQTQLVDIAFLQAENGS